MNEVERKRILGYWVMRPSPKKAQNVEGSDANVSLSQVSSPGKMALGIQSDVQLISLVLMVKNRKEEVWRRILNASCTKLNFRREKPA